MSALTDDVPAGVPVEADAVPQRHEGHRARDVHPADIGQLEAQRDRRWRPRDELEPGREVAHRGDRPGHLVERPAGAWRSIRRRSLEPGDAHAVDDVALEDEHDQEQRQRGQQAAGHEQAPLGAPLHAEVAEVLLDLEQVGVLDGQDRPHVRVPVAQERGHAHDHEDAHRLGQEHPHEDLPAARAVDHGGLLERHRDGQVELADEEHLERGRDARDDEHRPAVEHAQVGYHYERREQDRERRDEQGHDAEHPPQALERKSRRAKA